MVVWLLFTDLFTLDDKFRDLLNIIIGSFLVSFGKVVDFWFKGSHTEEDDAEEKAKDDTGACVDDKRQ